MSIRNLSDTRVEDALEIFSPSSIVKLDFVQTHGNWKIEAGNSGNNTLIIGSVSNATNNITLDTTNGGSATFAGTISSKDISIKQLDDSGFDGGLIIERSANTQKLVIGMDGGAVNFNSPDSLTYKFRANGTAKASIDGSGNATFAGNISVGGGQIITPGGVNLALNPNTGTVTVGGIIQCSGAGTSSFAGTVATTALDVQRSSGSNDDILRITSADVVTTIQRIENSSDAASGFGRIEFKTNAATGQVSGRGGFKFIDGDGNDILYLDNDNAAATFAGKVNINDNGGLYLNVNSAAQSDIAVFKNNNGSIVLGYTSNLASIDLGSSQAIRIRQGSNVPLTIDSSGKVGIGTTSPNYLLEVGNSTQTNSNVFSGRVNGDFIFNLSKANTNLFSIRNDTTNAVHLNTQNSAKLALGVSTGTSTGSVVSNLVIDSSGNVGIGTTSPSSPLEIFQGGSGKVTLLQLARPNNPGLQSNIKFTVADIMVGQIQHEYEASNLNHMSFTLRAVDGSDIIPLWLQNSGNVGIGTTSPAEKLEVSGSIKIGNLKIQNANSGRIGFNRNTATGAIYDSNSSAIQINGPSSSLNYLSIEAYNSSGNFTSQMVYTGSGNLGIGTTSPGAKLDVNGATYVRNVIYGYAGTGNQYGGLSWTSTDTGFLFLKHGNVNKVVLNANDNSYFNGGKVGIGTTSPTRYLHILNSSGDTRGIMVENTVATSYSEVQVKAAREFRIGTGGSSSDINASDRFYIYDATATAHRFTIGSTGNVGIGTTSPSYKLEVNGTANIVSHLTAHCLGVGTAAPAANGVIRAAGDVIAYYSSDKRLKNNITKIEKPLEKLEKINGYEFDWNDKQELYEGHDVGVVAQEIEEVYPQLVETREDGYKAVKYEKLVPLLIESIKELKKEIDNIKNKSWQSDY